MESITVYAPLGMLGYGFPERSLNNAVSKSPDVIAVDAGSTDPGAYYLGTGTSFTSNKMVKRDLLLLLKAALSIKCPLIIGSVGGAGAKPNLEKFLEIFHETINEVNPKKTLKVAIINSEVKKEYLIEKIKNQKTTSLEHERELTYDDLKESKHIVAQLGVEPIIEALKNNADIIIMGRAYDAALMAAFPILKGFSKGLAYHMGKILECGSLIAVPRESDGAIGVITKDSFTIEPADPLKKTTVEFVAAHTLYEKTNPVFLKLPGGNLDLQGCEFYAINDRVVKVKGSKFKPSATYKLKIEGAALAGYRTICIAGIRDPLMIKNLDVVIKSVREKIIRDLGEFISENDYSILYHKYGIDAVLGDWEYDFVATKEVGLVIEVVGKTQEIANTVCALARSATLHNGYENRKANAGNLAFLFTPAEFSAPPSYEFNIYHLVEIEDPCKEGFEIQYKEVKPS